MLRDAGRDNPTVGETLHAAVATAYLLLNSDGHVDMAYRILTVALEAALADPDQAGADLSRALYTLAAVCQFSGRPDYWSTLDDVVARHPQAPTSAGVLLGQTQADPLTASPCALEELDRAVGRLGQTLDVGLIIRTAVAGFNVDRLSACRKALDRVARDGREGGAVGSAIMALSMIAFDDLHTGRWDAAQRAALDATELCADLGYRLYEWSGRYALALVAANRGDRQACDAGCRAMLEWAGPRRLGRLASWAHHALAMAALGEGDFEAAHTHGVAISPAGTLGSHNPQALWFALGLVDAALHTGRSDEARAHAEALRDADLARLSPRYALSTTAALAMVAPDSGALALFDEALASAGAGSWPFELARVQLVYGERLRRMRRTRDARDQLQAAQDRFDRLGAASWSRRASSELRATGATRVAGGAESLTPQEVEVARLAAGGLTNREIAARLYLSPRTVSAHLYRAFPKLGVTTRAALRDALDATSSDTAG
jgi:DNA-binding CsgD family transcriptional regulator